jgi:hypothetical protein
VCKKFRDEGVDLLYDKNKFCNFCGHNAGSLGQNFNHIVHTLAPGTSESFISIAEKSSALQQVRHWHVLVSFDRNDLTDHSRNMGHRTFLDFCRAIQHGSTKSLEIAILSSTHYRIHSVPRHEVETFLQTLRLLRGEIDLVLREASQVELPQTLRHTHWQNHISAFAVDMLSQLQNGFSANFRNLIPPDNMSGMWKSLITYAKSFEQSQPFRIDIEVGRGERVNAAIVRGEHCATRYGSGYTQAIPFKSLETIHPVEDSLMRAMGACDFFDMPQFK